MKDQKVFTLQKLNDFLNEAMKTNFSAYETRIVAVLLRFTYGYYKGSDRVAVTQFIKKTGLDVRHIKRSLDSLYDRKIIDVSYEGKAIRYAIHEQYSEWIREKKDVLDNLLDEFTDADDIQNIFLTKHRPKPIRKGPVEQIDSVTLDLGNGEEVTFHKSCENTSSLGNDDQKKEHFLNRQCIEEKNISSLGTQTLPVEATTDNLYSDNKKNKSPNFSEDSDVMILASLLLGKIRERDPRFKEPDLQKWATHIDYLIRIDKRTAEEIRAVIEWCQADDFWKTNILSTEKLRKQFSSLWLKMPDALKYPKEAPKEKPALVPGLDGKPLTVDEYYRQLEGGK